MIDAIRNPFRLGEQWQGVTFTRSWRDLKLGEVCGIGIHDGPGLEVSYRRVTGVHLATSVGSVPAFSAPLTGSYLDLPGKPRGTVERLTDALTHLEHPDPGWTTEQVLLAYSRCR